ncbi:hypothetical protein [Streptomyces sp. S186]|uniref:hypothetical protein n=1 Tax=Streptomyces sp. S186 TaxID=3434395 RepID=UPI003F67BDB6
MADDDERQAAVRPGRCQQVHGRHGGVRGERRGALVAWWHVRFGGQGAGEGHPLTFAPGQLVRTAAGEVGGQPGPVEEFGHLAGDVRPGGPAVKA